MTSILDLCSRFSWSGPGELVYEDEELTGDQLKRRQLTDWIYRRFHAKVSGPDFETRMNWGLLAQLRELTPYRTVPDPGWRWLREERSGPVLEKGGIEVLAPELKDVAKSAEETALDLPAWRPHLSPGFFILCGPSVMPDADLVRIYLSGSQLNVPEMVRGVLELPPARTRAWSLKVVGSVGTLHRTDAGVLYVTKVDSPAFLEALAEAPWLAKLEQSTSEFTCNVEPGLGWALDPGGKVSFGEHISGLLADSLLRGRTGIALGIAARAVFEEAGVSLHEPWLAGQERGAGT